MVAAMIFSLVTVGLAALFRGAERSSVANSQRLCADHFASQLIEEAIDDARVGVVPKPDSGVLSARSVRRGAVTKTDYRYEVEVRDLPGGVKDVHVTVEWDYQEKRLQIEREVLVCPLG